MPLVAIALLSSVLYGSSDFLAGSAARRLNVLAATAASYAVATVVMLAALPILHWEWSALAGWAGAAAAVFAVVGFVTFYAALAIGPMSLLSPAIALIGAVIPVVVSGATGHSLSALAWTAIVIALVATVLISVTTSTADGAANPQRIAPRVAVYALVAGVTFGLSIAALDFAPPESGLLPALIELAGGLAILGALLGALRIGLLRGSWVSVFEPPSASGSAVPRAAFSASGHPVQPDSAVMSARAAWLASGFAGVLLGVANALLMVALHGGDLAVVGVLISLYPLATVILAWAVHKERITAVQLLGIVLAITAAVLLGMA